MNSYRVHLRILWDAETAAGIGQTARCETELTTRLNAAVGDYWLTTISSERTADRADLTELRLSCPPVHRPTRPDKQFLLAIRRAGFVWKVTATEYDGRTRIWSPLVEKETFRDDFLTATCVERLRDAFQPLFRIVTADGDQISMIAVAGELLPPDPEFAAIEPGSIAAPRRRRTSTGTKCCSNSRHPR